MSLKRQGSSSILVSMNNGIYAVRCAVAIAETEDEAGEMLKEIGMLMRDLAGTNGFIPDDVVSVQFTQTSDLKWKNAAAALRDACPEYGRTPLFCSQEPDVYGMLPRIVRILVTVRGKGPGKPVYLGKAESLRPDLSGGA